MSKSRSSSQYSLQVTCNKCHGGPVRAVRSKDRVLIRCEACGNRVLAYYLDPDRWNEDDLPPEREDEKITRQVESDLLDKVTPPARALYDFLVRFVHQNHYSPSTREIQRAIGWDSPNTVMHYLKQLEAVGLIERRYAAHRGIRLIHAA